MKKYFIIAGVSFALGAGTLFYTGIADEVAYLSESLAARNEQTLTLDLALASENLERVKLDTELYRLQHQLDKRKLELEIEALNELENERKLELESERKNELEWAWWVNFTKIFWLLVISIGLPVSALSVLVFRAFVSALREQDHDQTE